jgi:hypothetical protein
MTCVGNCVAKFPQLPANTALDLDHIVCEVGTTGTGVLTFGQLQLLPASLNFIYPLTVQWERKFFGGTIYTLAADVNIRVPAGKQFEIDTLAGGTPSGRCTVTGTRISSS